MKDFICLFFDADGIVRATDTIVANHPEEAADRALELLGVMTSLDRVELWEDGKRVFRSKRRP